MKTPRKILLERHQTAAPKLDEIRHQIAGQVSSLSPSKKAKSETGKMPVLLLLWRELIFPSRRIWASLSVIWILIFIFNFSQRDKTELMAKNISPTPEMIVAYRQQAKLLAELIGQTTPQVAEPPRIYSPKPRTETMRFETV